MTEREIFAAVLEVQDAQERYRRLDNFCQGDAALRERIAALLAEREKLGDYLETPPTDLVQLEEHAATAPLGSQIGSYKLLEQIGEGGMGLVYLAEQHQPLRRLVALKIVKPGMDSRQIIARFEAERQVLAMLDHANVAKVLDAGTTNAGRLYFVMELVKGVPITRFCDEQGLTIKERLELFVPICQAIQHAHQKGIIHRDIKPTNVLVALYDGVPVPKVIDFGVAKATAQQFTNETMFTGAGHLIGTLEYMSPEQAQFNQLDIDTRSDIYSLGVLLYELLTGSTPVERSRLRTVAFDETLRIIREEEPETVSSRMARTGSVERREPSTNSFPRSLFSDPRKNELDWIVMKALEKDRARRYETASALAADISRYLRDEPVQACPPTVGYRLRKFVQRNKTSVLAGVLVLLALVGGIVGTTWQMILAKHERALAVRETGEKNVALEAARTSERNAKEQLFLALLHRSQASRFSRRMGQRLDSLAAATDAARIRSDERLRDEAIAAMALPDVRRVPVMGSLPPGTTAVGFDSQYQIYARANNSGLISVRRTEDDQEIRQIAAGPVLGESLFFSPDDRFLLAIMDGFSLGVWRLSDGQRAIPGDYRSCWRNAFSPDGQRLAVSQKEQVICFDLATGKEINRWSLPGPVNALAFHPDGIQLAVGQSRASVIYIYDVTTGTRRADLNVGAMKDQVVAWHPDGERLAVSGIDPRIHIWNVSTKRKLVTMEGHAKLVATLAFHPDGSLLASHSWDGTLRFWETATGRPVLQLSVAVSGHPQFSRDGRWVAGALAAGGRVELLEVTPSPEYRTLVSSGALGRGAYNPADISPDGRVLAVGKAEGMEPGIRLWDLYTGKELATLPAGTNFVSFDSTSQTDQAWSLLTCGSDGLQHWPVTSDDSESSQRLRLGPPRKISTLSRAWFARSSTGRTLAAVTQEGGSNQILDLKTGTVRQSLGVHPNGDVRALSPDGRWAASSGWHSQSVRLWNAASGELIHEWFVGKQTFVFFTPDSRNLIISRADEFSFWDVQTLKPGLRLARDTAQSPSHVSFSADGNLMALEMAPASMHLMEVATGRTVAKFEDPYGDRATWHGFTPDGTQLVVVSSYASAIHVWDLRAIRTRLTEMNLDWDWPDFSPKRPAHTIGKENALIVDLVPGELTPSID
jgi:eukaryotic-like serine/threonine-protein kinase